MATFQEMTQLSPTMTEGTIVRWLKKEGDPVSPGEILAEVETDKAVMEMEAYDQGFLLAILAEPGSKISVGLPIAILGKKDEDITALIEEGKKKLSQAQLQKAQNPPTPSPPAPPPSTPVSSPVTQPQKLPQENPNPTPAVPPASPTPQKPSGRILASPLARKLAREKNIPLQNIQGTGPGGRILERDVYSYLEGRPQIHLGSGSFPSSLSYLDLGIPLVDGSIPISSMRKVIADRLTHSKNTLPHYYLNIELDAEPLVRFREKLNEAIRNLHKNPETPAPKVSLNDIMVKATALALEKHPLLRSRWVENQIQIQSSIDIGIAVSLTEGLITPVVRGANQLSLLGLSQTISQLVEKARNRKLKPEEYTGSCFTISNLGMYGIHFFTAIINEPESAILAVGSVQEKPVIKQGSVVPGKTLSLTLSCDHRIVDGAEGAKFLQTLRTIIENPELLS